MLFVLHGDNIKKRKEEHQKMVTKLGNFETIDIDDLNFNFESFNQYIGGGSLFDEKNIINIKGVLEDKDIRNFLEDKLKAMQDSDNIFFLIETDLDKKLLKKIKNRAKEIKECSFSNSKKDEFKVFSLTDSLGRKDKKNAWILYQKALDRGIDPIKIIGTIFWQIKNMMLAKKQDSVSSSVLHPFAFKKAQKYSSNFSNKELKNMLKKTLLLMHKKEILKDPEGTEKLILDIIK